MDSKQALSMLRQTALNYAKCYEKDTAEYAAWSEAAAEIARLPFYKRAEDLAAFVSTYSTDIDFPNIDSTDPVIKQFEELEKAYFTAARNSF